jgi:hypothetical protein
MVIDIHLTSESLATLVCDSPFLEVLLLVNPIDEYAITVAPSSKNLTTRSSSAGASRKKEGTEGERRLERGVARF